MWPVEYQKIGVKCRIWKGHSTSLIKRPLLIMTVKIIFFFSIWTYFIWTQLSEKLVNKEFSRLMTIMDCDSAEFWFIIWRPSPHTHCCLRLRVVSSLVWSRVFLKVILNLEGHLFHEKKNDKKILNAPSCG